MQALARQIALGKQNRTFVVILSPVVPIPIELEKLFVVIEHELPGREQLEEIARGVATEDGELPDGPELDSVLDAAAGLTRYEAENAFSLSLGPAPADRTGVDLGAEGRDAKEKRPASALPGRRTVRAALAGWSRSRRSVCGPCGTRANAIRASGLAACCFLGVPGTGKSPTARPLVPKLAVPRSSWTWAR